MKQTNLAVPSPRQLEIGANINQLAIQLITLLNSSDLLAADLTKIRAVNGLITEEIANLTEISNQ